MAKERKPLQRTSGVETEQRVSDLYQMMLDGIPKKQLIEECSKKWQITKFGVQHIYTRALARIKAEFSSPVEDIRAGVIADLLADIRLAMRNYERYDSLGDAKSSELAHKWFNTYIALKKEYIEYYPGVKPKEAPQKDDDLSIIFMADDGIDEEPKQLPEDIE